MSSNPRPRGLNEEEDDRPPFPRVTREGLIREVEENPDLKAALGCDTFVGKYCVRCSCAPALFATPIMHGSCPRCLAERMRRLMEAREVPWWVRYLAKAGEAEADRQESRWLGRLEVSFDDLVKCGRCGTLRPLADVRYHIVDGRSPPYCIPCHEVMKRTIPA